MALKKKSHMPLHPLIFWGFGHGTGKMAHNTNLRHTDMSAAINDTDSENGSEGELGPELCGGCGFTFEQNEAWEASLLTDPTWQSHCPEDDCEEGPFCSPECYWEHEQEHEDENKSEED